MSRLTAYITRTESGSETVVRIVRDIWFNKARDPWGKNLYPFEFRNYIYTGLQTKPWSLLDE
ncbi:hypothetical protein [Vibrio phage vB_VhaP_PG11]|nr:hypothetical protein [Vibrio phage vB_VhaP_PG11]